MAGKFSVLFLVGFVAAVVVAPYMMAEARYLPTRGNDDRLTRLKELLTDVSSYMYFGVKKKHGEHIPLLNVRFESVRQKKLCIPKICNGFS
ncbi:unnamed protein product [Macrosiphum euphorbiae]|uniref:Transmembrane protein n=1 Tax=Macrosiphum euphorbiae TaxID=13131 RepID=A0AAV0W8B4_9HEMI|nr:unnamed protein product [Macrosiphum euphorbiae]